MNLSYFSKYYLFIKTSKRPFVFLSPFRFVRNKLKAITRFGQRFSKNAFVAINYLLLLVLGLLILLHFLSHNGFQFGDSGHLFLIGGGAGGNLNLHLLRGS